AAVQLFIADIAELCRHPTAVYSVLHTQKVSGSARQWSDAECRVILASVAICSTWHRKEPCL
ncbi:unnamed protein product, partial [Nippostrongylus brasiliensis]|uniref:Transposase n=1 Tax=Nippostrongylus brasiliensis TaxID=27835 RepID=A0A0N4XPR0_NIPBR